MRILALITSLIIVNVMSGCNEKTKESGKPLNVLFLFADDQRFSTINALNNREIITPALEQLSENSVVFNNAYIMGAMNAAVCAPSRAMLMTGRNMFQIDPRGQNIDVAHKTMPEALKANGYFTFGTGKWHNGKASYGRGFSSGAKILFNGMTGSQYKLPLFEFDSTGKYSDDHRYMLNDIHSSEVYAGAAIEFLQNYKEDKPFFMYVSFQAPHDPRQAPEKYLEMYDTANISLPPNFLLQHPFDNGELDVRDEMLAGFPRQSSEIKKHIRAYYAMITHLDHQVGRIIEALKASGEFDNTIIVFAGDNGLALGQHGLMGKQSLYEHSIKVPLFISGPDLPKKQVEDLIYLNDLYPTLLSLLNIKIPESVTGYSYKEAIENMGKGKRSSAIFAYKNFQRAYRKGDWKLIAYNVRGEKHNQLFNLKEDPWETNNLYLEKDSIANAMERELQDALMSSGDSVKLDQPAWGVAEIPSWAKMIKKSK